MQIAKIDKDGRRVHCFYTMKTFEDCRYMLLGLLGPIDSGKR